MGYARQTRKVVVRRPTNGGKKKVRVRRKRR